MQTITFICGCGHSGTSLLANMFASHGQVYIPLRETNVFLKRDKAAENWAALREEASETGRPHLVEKTPRHVQRLDLIRDLVPGARLILMVRDGRDVAASFVKRVGSAEAGMKRWIGDNHVVALASDAEDVRIQRYEDLIDRPEEELRAICDFIGLPFDPAMLDYHKEDRRWFGLKETREGTGEKGTEHLHLRNWQINQPIFDTRGKWREVLSAEDEALFEVPKFRKLMQRFGYA